MEKKKEETGQKEVLLEIRNLSKTFGPVVALNQVDLDVHRGEILGLIGENGSGKSTVSSIFSGVQPPDSGIMLFHGKPWNPTSMKEALSGGIGMIVQENGTVPGITVAENLFLCRTDEFSAFRTPSGDRWGPIKGKELYQKAQEALDEIGAAHIKARTVTGTLDLMDRKLIEVAKVWMQKPEILVVDESTTALSQKGREIVYKLMERMKKENRAVVFISHDLDEIMEKCDTLTVLRDGKRIQSFEKKEFDAEKIRTAMIGRTLQGDYYRSDTKATRGKEIAIEAKDVHWKDQLKGVDLVAYRGEILGIGGLSQCGMHPLGKILFGALNGDTGSVTVGGKRIRNPVEAIRAGIGYVAKDRDTESLCLSASIKDNISIAGFSHFAKKGGFLLPRYEKKYVKKQIDFMRVKCFSMEQPVWQLSGGNKQKVVFGKWIGAGSEILILDCPTRGIDIGVKQTMYQLMAKMKEEGKTMIMISEELSELIGMSDRLLILKNGKVTKEFERSPALSDADLIGYMI